MYTTIADALQKCEAFRVKSDSSLCLHHLNNLNNVDMKQ